MSRARQIHDELERHFTDETKIAVSVIPAEVWRKLIDDEQSQFGWRWPVGHSGPPMIVRFCPEIIDEQTTTLTDHELQQYLDFVEWVCDTHVSLWETETDPFARQRITLEELEDIFPGSLVVWFRMQLSVLGVPVR